jgi:hypothetical protein
MRLAMGAAVFLTVVVTSGAAAQDLPGTVQKSAQGLFPELPNVERVARIEGECGADSAVNPVAAYCTSRNVILLRDGAAEGRALAHLIAHLYGHAVQVRHGVADIALREIRARRAEEAKLRGWVTRQVDCIAGAILSQAGMHMALDEIYSEEPLTGSHWGRDPLSVGPKVSIGLEARAEWFEIGQQQGLAACAPGEFGSELLLNALRPGVLD